jgi:hypothetical protein
MLAFATTSREVWLSALTIAAKAARRSACGCWPCAGMALRTSGRCSTLLISPCSLSATAALMPGGLVVADRVRLDCVLGFVCLHVRAQEPAIASAWRALQAVWS